VLTSLIDIYFCYLIDGPAISYDVKQPTTKPDGLFVTIHPRIDFPEPSADIDFQTPSKNADEPEFDLENITSTTSVDLPKITFLFGTQTGSAQDYANQLSIQAKRFGFKDIKLCSMDQWELLEAGKKKDPKEKELVIICTATYK
jgi:cytochrome P450/NADPH-cytochrome P450 reductase